MIAQQNNSSCSRICFPLNSVPKIIWQLCILFEDMFLLLENLLTNPAILKCILCEWVWLDLYNLETFFWFTVIINFKKYIAPLLRLVKEHSPSPSLFFFTVIKLQPHKSPEQWNLVPDPEAKSLTSQFTNLTLLTVSYHLGSSSGIFRTKEVKTLRALAGLSFYSTEVSPFTLLTVRCVCVN